MGYRVFGKLVVPGKGETKVFAKHYGDEWSGVERAFRRLTGRKGTVRMQPYPAGPEGVTPFWYLGRPIQKGGALPVIAEGTYYRFFGH